jgi:hypothetical protein
MKTSTAHDRPEVQLTVVIQSPPGTRSCRTCVCGHYELATDEPTGCRLTVAFTDLAKAI